jgi:hypothetical protein
MKKTKKSSWNDKKSSTKNLASPKPSEAYLAALRAVADMGKPGKKEKHKSE